MITLIGGAPGAGKTYCAVALAARLLRRGVRVFSTFAIRGATPLLTVADVLCDDFSDSVFIVDEAGLAFSNRQTADYDPLINLAFTQHRKGGVDLYIIVQSLGQLELNIKRVTECVSLVSRLGPSGEAARRSLKPAHWWQRPWAFRVESFDPERDFDDSWALKDNAVALSSHWVPYSRRVAEMYSSFERVVPMELRARVDELQRDAALRASLPKFRVERGKMAEQALPEGYVSLRLPRRMGPKEKQAPPVATLADEDLAGTLRSLGFWLPGDPAVCRPAASGAILSSSGLLLSEGAA